jgi:hypothetical protein
MDKNYLELALKCASLYMRYLNFTHATQRYLVCKRWSGFIWSLRITAEKRVPPFTQKKSGFSITKPIPRPRNPT